MPAMSRSTPFSASVRRSYSSRWRSTASARRPAETVPEARLALCRRTDPHGTSRGQIRVQDRLHHRLEANPFLHQLGPARHLPPAGQRRRIRDPHLGQEARGVELRQHACIDRVGLDFRLRDQMHLQWICHRHPCDMRRQDLRHRRRIAGRLDHDVIRRCSVSANASRWSRVIPIRPRRRSCRLRAPPLQRRPDGYPANDPHVSLLVPSNRELAGTRQLQIRARGASGQAAGATI